MGPPRRKVRESKAPKRFSSYMAHVTILCEFEPTTYEKAFVHQVWRDAIEAYPNLYYIVVGSVLLILLLYVDYFFNTIGEHLIDACKKDLASEFKMTELRSIHYYLGMEVW